MISETLSTVGSAGWRLHDYEQTGSTNDVARVLPGWHAVRAGSQTGGRGRYGRVFVSDEGGLWLSAVLPAAGDIKKWQGLSLVVGWHLLMALQRLGVPGARLRWPNDLMAQDRKLAGLLIEQPNAGVFIVGLGMNVTNAPWERDASLAQTTTRLCDLLPHPPSLDELTAKVLDAIANAHEETESSGMGGAISKLNEHWMPPRAVKVILSGGGEVSGLFEGLDEEGHLRVSTESGIKLIGHYQVERLHEIQVSGM